MALPLKNKTKFTVSTFCRVFRQNWVCFCQMKRSFLCSSCVCASEMPSSGLPGGVTALFVNQIELGCYELWDKASNFVPRKGLAKETLLLSREMQWAFAHFGRPQPPLSRADVQWVVLVRVPLWVDSLYKVWFNVKHEWVFDLVSRAEITAHSFVQPLH